VRFRLKQKYQAKNLPKSAWPTRSNTRETTLRTFATLTDRDFINLQLFYGEVRLTPSEMYGSDVLMSGFHLSSYFEHHLSPNWNLRAECSTWRADGGASIWYFEDVGIDFLYGEGMRYAVTITDRLSDAFQVKMRVRGKDTRYHYNGIYGPSSEYYYAGLPGVPVRDFLDSRDLWRVELQLDLRW
jgi:hypothetical protein